MLIKRHLPLLEKHMTILVPIKKMTILVYAIFPMSLWTQTIEVTIQKCRKIKRLGSELVISRSHFWKVKLYSMDKSIEDFCALVVTMAFKVLFFLAKLPTIWDPWELELKLNVCCSHNSLNWTLFFHFFFVEHQLNFYSAQEGKGQFKNREGQIMYPLHGIVLLFYCFC